MERIIKGRTKRINDKGQKKGIIREKDYRGKKEELQMERMMEGRKRIIKGRKKE